MTKNVALCLSSGGSRGMAHIGAIEELEARGYTITSVSGTSIGSLIGGILAAGKIHEAHDWFCSLDKQQILSLTDFSFGLSHMVKGNKVLDAIKEWVPDRDIEDLPIPVAFVATDILNSREVVFTQGKLFEAIRASISIPMCFEPFRYRDTLLVDGGLTNPFPLNRVARTPGDILVGMNISAEDNMLTGSPNVPKELPRKWKIAKINRINRLWGKLAKELDEWTPQINYASLINRTIDVQIQAGCRVMANFCKPDVLAEMPQNAYSTFDFDKAAEIMNRGRELMAKALDEYEKNNQ
ncbi:MAG: patatin-like phospholipase family protein [Paludibacteraceae bacterium]|nr:patatin-like phospholipase family protein [Paludibacteraceae bacterium]